MSSSPISPNDALAIQQGVEQNALFAVNGKQIGRAIDRSVCQRSKWEIEYLYNFPDAALELRHDPTTDRYRVLFYQPARFLGISYLKSQHLHEIEVGDHGAQITFH